MSHQSSGQDTKIKASKTTFEIIEVLLEMEGATLTEVAGRTGKPKSTAFDYLQTLNELRYVVKRGSTYRVSVRFLEMGLQVRDQMELAKVAKPELQKLAEETGEYASLMIEEHGQGVMIDTVRGEGATDIGISPGTHVRLHTTAGGKAILAHLPEDRVDDLLGNSELEKATRNTITDPDRIRDQLREIRERGYATNDEERRKGTYAVAAPIQLPEDQTAAITVFGPAQHVSEMASGDLPKMVLRSANIIEVTFNYS